MVGLDPGPFTLRELVWMAEGHQRRHWDHTAQLVAAIAEPWRDHDEHPQPFAPWEFHPYQRNRPGRPAAAGPKVGVEVLKFLVPNSSATS